MSPELIGLIFQVSRYLFAFFGVLAALSALGWVHAEKKARRDRLRSIPAAGTVGELLVLAGSDELPVQTWFPVTREGVLGSVRSCDLVVPCPGVKAHHLDYCWKDGVGLLIRPRSGCEVLIDGFPLDCRSDFPDHPLTHGACLQVGQAVLRLQVLKALEPAYKTGAEIPVQNISAVQDGSTPFTAADYPPEFQPGMPQSGFVPGMGDFSPAAVIPPRVLPSAAYDPVQEQPFPLSPVQAPSAPHRNRTDSWKEDWSE